MSAPTSSITAAEEGSAAETADPVLSERQQDVLRLIADGLTNEEIGVELRITRNTVKSHIGAILRRTGAHSRTQAAVWQYRRVRAAGEEALTLRDTPRRDLHGEAHRVAH